MSNSNQHITLEILLKSLTDDFDAAERARIFQKLKDTEPVDEALMGAKMLLEENNWDYKALRNAFGKAQIKIDEVASGKAKVKQHQKNYLKYAAVVIPFIAVAGYFLLNTSKSIDDFFIKESGLPNLMGNENKNDWTHLMQLYKTNELEKAYEFSIKISESKKENDTANYFKAVIAYDLDKFDVATENFKNVEVNKQSSFYSDAEFRLGFSLLKSGNKEEAKQQFKKVKSNSESPYNSEATTILNEVFN